MHRQRVVLPALLMGSFLGVLDGFIVNVALPAIRADLNASIGETQLVVTAYAIAYAAGLVTGGRLGDRYGRWRLYVLGTVIFVVASAACAVAPNAFLLIVARALQGLAAAAMLPQVLSIIQTTLPAQKRRPAIGTYGATIGLGVVCGPALGGLLVAADIGGTGWRSIFLVNIPVGLVIILGSALVAGKSRNEHPAPLDLPGAGLLAAGVGTLLVSLTLGIENDWPGWTIGGLVVAPMLLLGFYSYERCRDRNRRAPLLPVRLFTETNGLTRSVLAILLLYVAGTSAPLQFVLSYYLQEGLDLAASRVGLILAPVGIGFSIGSALAPRLLRSYNERVPQLGTVLLAVAWCTVIVVDAFVPTGGRSLALVAILLVAGLGQGLAVNPLITLTLERVPGFEAGAMSGMVLTVTQLANAGGLVVIGSLFSLVLSWSDDPASASAFSAAFTVTVAILAVLCALACLLLSRLETRPVAAPVAG